MVSLAIFTFSPVQDMCLVLAEYLWRGLGISLQL